MNDMRAVVLAKFFKGELNPFDGAALELALQSGYKEVTVLAMAPNNALPALESITRLGAKAVLVSDVKFAGSDTIATTEVLAKAVERLSPDVILCGRQSVDGDTAQVPPMLAKRLGFSVKPKVMDVADGAYLLRNGETSVPAPRTLYTCERCKTLRFPSIFSKKGSVETWSNADLGVDVSKVGLAGSPTRVVRSYESTVGRRFCKFVPASELLDCIESGLQFAKKEKVNTGGEKLKNVYYVGDIEEVASSVGENVHRIDVTGYTPEALAEWIKAHDATTVLWEDSEYNKLFAPAVAVILGAGMCADCIDFTVQNGALIMTRPAQGGNITADITCTGKYAFATVRTAHKDGSDVMVCVGRGAVDSLDAVRGFTERLGAELCCTRVVVDGGVLPYHMQVGLTGKTVAPKVYVALGVSGAVQHTCSIASSGCIIAVNPDKTARIFDYADYGIVDKIENLHELFGGKIC